MTGKLALSKAGHDKDKLYLIVKEEQDTVYLADGRKRGLLNPKKKNRRRYSGDTRRCFRRRAGALLPESCLGRHSNQREDRAF